MIDVPYRTAHLLVYLALIARPLGPDLEHLLGAGRHG